MKPVFVSDLDGTLLGPDSRLSEASLIALGRLHEAGIPFTVATARGASSVADLFGEFPLRYPVLELNGALITDLSTGAHRAVHPIPGPLALEICEILLEAGASPAVSVLRDDRDCLFYKGHPDFTPEDYRDELLLVKGDAWIETADFAEACKHPVLSINNLGRIPELAAWREQVALAAPMSLSLVTYGLPRTSERTWLSVHHRTATKGQALSRWLALTGLEDHTPIVFGDGENDRSLFDTFPHSVAVANAIPELLDGAALKIGAHDENSVARFIEDWLSGRVGWASFPETGRITTG